MILAQPFSTTFTGQFLVPLAVTLAGAAIVGGFLGLRKLSADNRAARNSRDDNQRQVLERLDRQDEAITAIGHEVHTNSGSSLKDAVLRSEAAQTATAEKLDKHLQDAAYQSGRLDAFIAGGTPGVNPDHPGR